jgi:hypothetical protein
MHRRRRRHNVELSPGKTFTHARRLPAISKRGLQHMIWEMSLPKLSGG